MMSSQVTLKYVRASSQLTDRFNSDQGPVIFTHIPKAAGTTLDRLISVCAAMSLESRVRIKGSMYGLGELDAYEQLQKFPRDQFSGSRYVVGHLPYGVHEFLPTESFYYVTMLREPLARAVSHYDFGLSRKYWNEADSLGNLFDSGRMPDNLQVRMMSGSTDPAEPCDQAMLDLAVKHLHENYGLLGITEQFDDFLQKLIKLLDWPDIIYSNFQMSTRKSDPERKAALAKQARPFHEYDQLLYEEACKIIQEQNKSAKANVNSELLPSGNDKVLFASGYVSYRDKNYDIINRDDAENFLAQAAKQGVNVIRIPED